VDPGPWGPRGATPAATGLWSGPCPAPSSE
jgi:hypothetical protein